MVGATRKRKPPSSHERNRHPFPFSRPLVRAWLYAVAALMVLTLVVGGATRLTESGLSIVEWKPVTGVLPPLSQQAWQAEFAKYQQIPQYRELNARHEPRRIQDHLLVGVEPSPAGAAGWRGVPVAVPVFPLARLDRARLKTRLWTLFGAGALLGGVGWWMVSSGLAGRVSACRNTAWRST